MSTQRVTATAIAIAGESTRFAATGTAIAHIVATDTVPRTAIAGPTRLAVTTSPTSSSSLSPTQSRPLEPTQSSFAPSAVPVYRDPSGRFSFVLPQGWRIEQPQTSGVAVEIATDIPRGSVNLAFETLAGEITLDQYVAATIVAIQQGHLDYQLETAGIQQVMLGGRAARRYEFVGFEQGTRVRFTQYVTLVGNTAYVLTLVSADKDASLFLDEAKPIIDTLSWS